MSLMFNLRCPDSKSIIPSSRPVVLPMCGLLLYQCAACGDVVKRRQKSTIIHTCSLLRDNY